MKSIPGKCAAICQIVITVLTLCATPWAAAQDVVVLGTVDAAIQHAKSLNFCGEETRGKTLSVPRLIIANINGGWRQEATQVSVAIKKELFYRGLLPLVLYTNQSILKDRKRLLVLVDTVRRGVPIGEPYLEWLTRLDAQYKVRVGEDKPALANNADLAPLLDALQGRVDVIAPALVLGQGAYESAYGASRFAVTGHALFGQWTYDGSGMAPQKKRKGEGNYGVAAFDWPIEAVRSYINNLNTHRAYKPLRDIRADLRKREVPLTGLTLADGLIRYSEKGQKYVDTLKGIIRHNQLDIIILH